MQGFAAALEKCYRYMTQITAICRKLIRLCGDDETERNETMYSPTISWMAAAPRNVIMTRAEKTGVGGQSIGKIALAALAAFVAIAANIQTSTTA